MVQKNSVLGLGPTPGTTGSAPPLGIINGLGFTWVAPTLAQILTAANFTNVNAGTAAYTRSSSAYDAYVNTIVYINQRRQRPFVIGPTTYQADLIEPGRTNLLAFGTSEQLTAPAWSVGTGVPTITADVAAAPTGEIMADSFIEGTTNGIQSVQQSVTKAASSLAYAGSVYVHNHAGSREFQIELDDGTATNGVSMRILPTDGSVTSAPAAFGAGWSINTAAGTGGYIITSAGSGWYRVMLFVTSDATTTIRMRFGLWNGTTVSYAGNGTSGVDLWGCDVVQAAFGGSFSSIRNCLNNTEAFASFGTITRASVSSDAIADPITGNTTADQLIEDSTATSTHFCNQGFAKSASSLTFTFSVYAKANARTWIKIGLSDSGANTNSAGAYFDLGNGVTGSNQTTGTGFAVTAKAITSIGGGWYRCSITGTTDSSANARSAIWLATADLTNSYTGNGTSGAYVWGAQTEYGAQANTYWAVANTKGNRAADSLSITQSFSTTAGSLVCPVMPRGWTTDQNASNAWSVASVSGLAISRHDATTLDFIRNDSVGAVTGTAPTPFINNALSQVSLTWDSAQVTPYVSGAVGTPAAVGTLPWSAVASITVGGTVKFGGYVLVLYSASVLPGSSLAIIAGNTTAP